MAENKQGLGRNIPADLARAARKKYGFGCIICGKALIHYDHFGTEFKDANKHSDSELILLCGGHHDEKTRGHLPDSEIRRAIADPKCLQDGFTHQTIYLDDTHTEIVVGNLICKNVYDIIKFDGETVLSVLPPEDRGAPFRISAKLRDDRGNKVFEILENRWMSSSESWDVETTATRTVIRQGRGDIIFAVRVEPPKRLVIERINMTHLGHTIRGQEGHDFEILTRKGGLLRLSSGEIKGASAAIVVEKGELVAAQHEIEGISGQAYKLPDIHMNATGMRDISIGKISFKRKT